MKTICKILLTILFVPVFLFFLTAVLLRFQFLAPAFWEKSFTTSNTYAKLSTLLKKDVETKTIALGGKASDIATLTDLISPQNMEAFIEGNITNLLNFVNGKAKEIIVYLPFDKIPKGLLPENSGSFREQMKLSDFLTEFGFSGITQEQIKMLSRVGPASWIFLISSGLIAVLILLFLFRGCGKGKSLAAPGIALIIAGLLATSIGFVGNVLDANLSKNLAERVILTDKLLALLVPPVVSRVVGFWFIAGGVTLALGIILLFTKKIYNHSG